MSAGLPWSDPQFWIASGAVAAAAAVALWRALRPRRATELPCARCPQAAAHGRAAAATRTPPAPGPAAAPRQRLPILLLALFLAASAGWAERAERRVAAMGTTFALQVEAADRAAALAAAEALVAAVADAETRLSTWRGDTELARFNRAGVGGAVVLSAPTFGELAAALECSIETGGAFDPTVAPLVEVWDLRGAGRRPAEAELAAAREEVGAATRLAPAAGERSLTKRAPVRIEEGGFGKGAALARALEAAGARGVTARLDLGGQLAWTRGASPARVEIADPRDRTRAVVAVELGVGPGSLATSGNSERSREVGGERIGHLLDPATGRPAPEFGSVTVLAADPLRADCLSTALYVLGPERGLAWLAAHPGDEAVFLVVDAERTIVRATPGLGGRLRPLAAEVELQL